MQGTNPNLMPPVECHGLDNERQVFFYEQDFYVLSNFSAFQVELWGTVFMTSEHAYQAAKFLPIRDGDSTFDTIVAAKSAHDALKLAHANKDAVRGDWTAVRTRIMKDILRAKAAQHEYVRRKLLATGERTLIENSWRDDFWGWGPNGDGLNALGRLWMEIRTEMRGSNVS